MKTYSANDLQKIASTAPKGMHYRVNFMRHLYGSRYERDQTCWFETIDAANQWVADQGCDVAVELWEMEWYGDTAFANHNAKTVCIVTRIS